MQIYLDNDSPYYKALKQHIAAHLPQILRMLDIPSTQCPPIVLAAYPKHPTASAEFCVHKTPKEEFATIYIYPGRLHNAPDNVRNSKSPVLTSLAHELRHYTQYVSGKLRGDGGLGTGDTIWEGRVWTSQDKKNVRYENWPWEFDAFSAAYYVVRALELDWRYPVPKPAAPYRPKWDELTLEPELCVAQNVKPRSSKWRRQK